MTSNTSIAFLFLSGLPPFALFTWSASYIFISFLHFLSGPCTWTCNTEICNILLVFYFHAHLICFFAFLFEYFNSIYFLVDTYLLLSASLVVSSFAIFLLISSIIGFILVGSEGLPFCFTFSGSSRCPSSLVY